MLQGHNLNQNAVEASSDMIQENCYAGEAQSIFLYRSGTLARVKSFRAVSEARFFKFSIRVLQDEILNSR